MKTKVVLKIKVEPWIGLLLALCALLPLSGCGDEASRAAAEKPGLAAGAGVSPSATPAGDAAAFQDITESAGIHFRHQASHTKNKHMIEIMGSGGAFADFDGDGWADIILINNRALPGGTAEGKPGIRLYRNNHDRTFTDITPGSGVESASLYGMGVAAADYDNDGKIDFYVSAALDGGRLFHNQGNGKFEDVTARTGVGNPERWGTSCAWLDYNKDGKLDLFVCNYVKYATLKDDQPCFAGEEKSRTYCIPAAYEPSSCRLYRNDGDGRFTDVSEASGIAAAKGKSLGVAVCDVDKDGFPDLFVANDTTPGFLFRNHRDGTFKEVGVESGIAYNDQGIPHSGMGIDAATNADGKLALLITNYYGQETNLYHESDNLLFQNDRMSAGIGGATRAMVGFGAFFFDYDNDGRRDIFQANGHVQDDIQKREPNASFRQPTLLFQNRGKDVFTEVGLKSGTPFSEKIVGRGAAWADIDHDGRLDLLVTENDGPARLWRNETPTRNHWITVTLASGGDNRDALGAAIAVTSGGVTQYAETRTGSSYLSQSELCAHFGLGSATEADIRIVWPSGKTETIRSVPADRIVLVREGSGKAEPQP